VIALRLNGTAMNLAVIAPAQPAFQATLSSSNVYKNDPNYAASKALDDNASSRWATDDGTKQAWLQADFAAPTKIQGMTVVEAYPGRVQKFEIQYQAPGRNDWITLATGTHLGEDYGVRFAPVLAQSMRLNILDSTQGPTISEINFDVAK
jgi:alpha-L-fucosidase